MSDYEKAWLVQKWESILRVYGFVFTTEGELIYHSPASGFEDNGGFRRYTDDMIKDYHEEILFKTLGDNLCLAAMSDPWKNRIIIGPFGLHTLSLKDKQLLMDLGQPDSSSGNVPVHSMHYWKNAMGLLYQNVLQLQDPIFLQEPVMTGNMEYDLQEYRLSNAEAEVRRNSFQEILPLVEAVRQGDAKAFMENYDPTIYERIGRLASSSIKQTEYLAVKTITLFMHAMIDGGVDYNVAYDLSDLYLQKLERTRSLQGMYHLIESFIGEAIKTVYADREQRTHQNVVEEAKNYVRRNLRRDFRIAEMAEELHINGSYLSRRFSSLEGMTIQQFVLKERLRAACNMLKYSDRTISEIAHTLQFSSQSYFSSVFRKEYGLPPRQFRERNRKEGNAVKNNQQ